MRKYSVLLVSALAFAACADQPNEPAVSNRSTPAPVYSVGGNQIRDSYIVVLNENANPRSVAAVAGVNPHFVYEAALNGFSAELNQGQLNALQHNPNVAYIEPDQEFTADATVSAASWGLDRIDQRNLPLSGTFTYTSTATAVRAYVIDTGIQTSHPQFGGRASAVYDALGGNGQDCNGHGTHVAGTIGGSTYGIARGAMLRAVRVLNCSGSGATSGIIAAVDWVRTNGIKPAVANMSLGGGFSSSLNTAVNNLANSGIFIAVAAGNENQNACNVSPASASAAYTTAASTSTDAKASYSNWGSCVDGYAPGSSITSAWINSGTNTISGTSMASPHVAGVAALYKGNFGDAASSTISSWINSNATANVITGNVTGTPNRLLYKASL
ncbi:MAG TPA: S8 family serine peptidase [Longimicrobiales bacterium]|nr:S8 family serine peptidase [Longimicrobiales bacterium]